MSNTETDFSNDIIEKLLLKKIYTDINYTAIFRDIYDQRWCEDKSISLSIKLVLMFYKKYDRLPNQRIISELLKKYCEKHHDVDHKSVMKTFIETISYDLGIEDDCAKANIQKFIKNRGLYFSIFDNINDIEKNKSIDKCLQRFEIIQNVSFDADLGMNYFEDQEEHWDYMMNPEARISTGFDALDKITNGGFYKDGRSLYVFMGQPGLGKSTVLSNLAYNFLKTDKNVVVISLEMSEDIYASRFDAHISNDNINRLSQTHRSSRTKIESFFHGHPNSSLYIKEYPPRTIRPSDIEIYLDKLVAKGVNIDVIIIDYLNLVMPQNSGAHANSYERVLQVAEKLRAMSYKYRAPVITATQANTEGFNNADIGMEHVSESRGVAASVDFMAALYQVDDDIDNGVINMKILKNRLGGKVGKVMNFKLDPETLTLDDISFSDYDDTANSDFDEAKSPNTMIVEDNLANIANDLTDL